MNRSNVGANTNITQILADIFMMAVSFGIVCIFFHDYMQRERLLKFTVMVITFAVIYIIANKEENVYDITLFFYWDRIYRKITKSFLIASVIIAAMLYLLTDLDSGRKAFFVFLIVSYILLCLDMIFLRYFIQKKTGTYIPRVVYVGKTGAFNKFRYFLAKTNIIVDEIGYVALTKEDVDSKEQYIGVLDELEEIIKEYNVDQVYILQKRDLDLTCVQTYIDLCIEMGVTVKVIMDVYRRRKAYSYVSTVGTYPIITYHTICLNNYEKAIKRVVDLLGGLVGCIVFSPFMLATAIAIKLDSPGPVLFKQTRVGQNGRQFKIYKFRSMYMDAEARKAELMAQNEIEGGIMFKMKDDPRVTKVGRFIRKTSLDELPQFFNVVQGTMSLVGTRPPTLDEVEKYKRNQWRRISIKPGITGMWQVSGRSNIDNFDDIVEMDIEYIDNWNLMMDIKIICKTVLVLLNHKGAY